MTRRLTLSTERLTELSPDDLGSVVGGNDWTTLLQDPSINGHCTTERPGSMIC